MAKEHFLSYAREDDKQIAEALYLELVGGSPSVPVWRDQNDLGPGDRFGDVIRAAIQAASSFLFVMTPRSVESEWCLEELQHAKSCGKVIIPLRFFQDIKLPLGSGLSERNCCDFVDRDRSRWERGGHWSRQSWKEAVAKLRLHLVRLQEETPVDLDMVVAPLELRREELRRHRRSESDPRLRKRIRLEIDDLTRKIDELQGRGADPGTAGFGMVVGMIEDQRSTAADHDRGLFVNAPPAEVPEYFRGRDAEIEVLVDFLCNDSQRLLMITGRGGIGKTALVCHLLQSLQDGDPPPAAAGLKIDGIVFLRVAGTYELNVRRLSEDLLRSKPEAAERLHHKLDTLGPGTKDRVEALLEEFPAGRTILVLDNFEDLIDAQRRVSHDEIAETLEILCRHPLRHGLKVILTTRVAPRKPNLLAPPWGRLLELRRGLAPADAVAVLRAMDPDGLVGLREASEELLHKAGELTEGNPRALETLAGILAGDFTVTLEEVLEDARRLPGDVLEVLIGEAFQRLDLPTQRVMQALAIYGRPVSAAAIDYLLRPYLPSLDNAEILRQLVNMRFVHKNGRQFYLHSVDQTFVSERTIPAGGETQGEGRPFTRDALLLLAADYCREVRKPRGDLGSMSDLEPQLAEIDLRCQAGDFENAARVLLDVDVSHLGRWAQYQTMVDLHRRLEGKLEKPSLKEANFKNLGLAYAALGDSPKATHYFDLALQEAKAMEDPVEVAELLITHGNLHSSRGQTRAAQVHYEDALEKARNLGDLKSEVKCLCNIGNVFLDLGDAGKALELYEQADRNAQEARLREMTALIRYNAGRALLALDRPDEAVAKASNGLAIGLEFHNWRLSSFCGYLAALVHFFRHDLDAAESALQEAMKMAVPENEHDLLALGGLIALRRRQLPSARHGFAEASRHANVMIQSNPSNYLALYTKGLALAGLTLCENRDYLSPAVRAYEAAREINHEAGVAARALRLFDALREEDASGVLSGIRILLASA
jgi:tetratricopeptide (TPR) repeat protein